MTFLYIYFMGWILIKTVPPKLPIHAIHSPGLVAADTRPPATMKSRTHLASWYGPRFHGRLTASGEIFDMYGLTAAHPDLPLGTVLKVTNSRNGKSVTVRINDRGPYIPGRDLDLSYAAARQLGFEHEGLTRVRWQKLGS